MPYIECYKVIRYQHYEQLYRSSPPSTQSFFDYCMYPLSSQLTKRATTKPPQSIIDLFQSSKTRLLALAIDPTSQPQSAGVKAAAWKFVQKVLLAGTRAAAVDPRVCISQSISCAPANGTQLQSRGPSDPNISMISPGSPLSPADLEEEAKTLRTQLVMQMYSLR